MFSLKRTKQKNQPIIISSSSNRHDRCINDHSKKSHVSAFDGCNSKLYENDRTTRSISCSQKTSGDNSVNEIVPIITVDNTVQSDSIPILNELCLLVENSSVFRMGRLSFAKMKSQLGLSKLSKLSNPLLIFLYAVCDAGLNLLVTLAPSLKTKSISDYKQKFIDRSSKIYLETKIVTKLITRKCVNKVYHPIHQQLLLFRAFYNENWYDSGGKPIVRGSLDVIFGPFNTMLKNVFKIEDSWMERNCCCEFDRTLALPGMLVVNVLVKASKLVFLILKLPMIYLGHTNYVINRELDIEESTASPSLKRTIKKSAKILVSEIVDSVVRMLRYCPAKNEQIAVKPPINLMSRSNSDLFI